MSRFFPLLAVAAMLAVTPAGATTEIQSPTAQSATPIGVWMHANKRFQIEIAPCADRLCAKVVWLLKPNNAEGLPRTDVNNPDPALRARPVLGLEVLNGLRQTGADKWEDGNIYNPDDGSNYRAALSLDKDGNLKVRAYVLVSLLGKDLIWTRVK